MLVSLLLVLLWLRGWEGKKWHDAVSASPGLCNEGEATGGVQVEVCMWNVSWQRWGCGQEGCPACFGLVAVFRNSVAPSHAQF